VCAGAWAESGMEVTSSNRSTSRVLMVTGEETGRVKLFRSPVNQRKASTHCHVPPISCLPSAPAVCLSLSQLCASLALFPSLFSPSPAPSPQQAHHVVYGHSGSVTKVRFTCDDSRVLSCGGRDRTIIQWRLEKPDTE